MRVFNDQIDKRRAAQILRQRPCRRLVDPHQRRVNDKGPVHTQRQRARHALNGVVAAIGIAGKIRFAHAANQIDDAAPIGERRGESQKQQIASRHKSVGQTVGAHGDFGVSRQRCFRNRP